MFTNKDLKQLIIPLIIEQILAVTIGMADTIMVSSVSEAAVSGLSLVDSINILLINIFAALATGGAVVAAQYVGCKDQDHACLAAKQLLLSTGALAIVIMMLSLVFNKSLLRLIFGVVEPEVMSSASTFFYICACSYPFIALYNSGAALFRAMGNSRISMTTSLMMNVINIAINAVLIYVFHMGVAGAAAGSLIARIFGASVMLFRLHNAQNVIFIDTYKKLPIHWNLIKKIMTIGIPNGLENGMFQIGKICLQGVVASFGTTAIAANAVANNIASMEVIPGSAIGLGMITVVGQCIGAGKYEEARSYMIKLVKTAYAALFGLNIMILLLAKYILRIYNLSDQTLHLAFLLLLIHGLGAIFFWVPSFTLPNGLRAANDAKFTMTTSIFSMWCFRIGFGIFLSKGLNLGVIGIWIAMIGDWFFRDILFITRLLNNKWKGHRLI